MAKYAESHNENLNKINTNDSSNNKRQESVSLKGNVEAVLQAVASAAAKGSVCARVFFPTHIGIYNYNYHRCFSPSPPQDQGRDELEENFLG